MVATFRPTGNAFQDFAATFTLGSAGNYTITLAGATTGGQTAFVDAVSLARSGARASHQAFYYDAAHRPILAVDVGTAGGRGYDRPTLGPARSDAVLAASLHYDDAGRVDQTIDPLGVAERTRYDALGRVVETVAAATPRPAPVGAPTASANSTIRYAYDGLDRVVAVAALAPDPADDQVTTYVYGVTPASGSKLASNALLAAEVQSDGATTSYSYDALGEAIKSTDPNGTVHQYAYDALGRLRSDSVTTLGAGVDGSIRRLETAYDSAGRAYLFTSYDAAAGGNVVNQVKRTFNGYGQLLAEYQAHSGAVDASSLKVQYAYSTPGPGLNASRIVSETYPNGRVLGYSYGAAGGLDDAIGRIAAITEGAGGATIESYAYLGLATVVERVRPGAGVKLSHVRAGSDAAAGSDAGDLYSGLDRFGRVVDQNWVWTDGPAAGTSAVRLQYGYDRGGNALYRDDLVNAALGELYRYDQLDRLTSFKRGVLSATNDAVPSPTLQQSWALDARGNQTGATTNGATVARTFNEANETASVSGGSAPVYDAAGNTVQKDGRSFVYDAWGRLKRVVQGATTLASYAYDALRRGVVETSSLTGTADVYFDGSEPIEERVGSFGTQNVLGVDGALVLHDVYPDVAGPAEPDWRTYSLQDANGNVVALVGSGAAAGNVVERYAYAPFGAVAVLNAAGVPRASSPYNARQLFQGGRYDYATGLYQFGFRDYDPASGTWMERDPIGLAGMDPNLYRFVAGNPVNYVDPSGLFAEDGWYETFFNYLYGNYTPTAPLAPNIPDPYDPGYVQSAGNWRRASGADGATSLRMAQGMAGQMLATVASEGGKELASNGVARGAGRVVDALGDAASSLRSCRVPTGKAWKAKISGRAQKTGTPGHRFRTYREAIAEAKKPEVQSVHLDHGYNRALELAPRTIAPNRRPDVVSVYKDGKVVRIEVQSKSDEELNLIIRNQYLNEQLRGQGFAPQPPWVVLPTTKKP